MEERRSMLVNSPAEKNDEESMIIAGESTEEGSRFTAEVVAPIITQGDPIGAVIICSKEPNVVMGDLELKLAETAAGFLAKQMEQ
jgi:AbrB family transcriptional regulator (stage V sporulation protein T)